MSESATPIQPAVVDPHAAAARKLLQEAIAARDFAAVEAALTLSLMLSQRILDRAQPGTGSRHEYANGKGTLSGVSLAPEDVLCAQRIFQAAGLAAEVVIDRVPIVKLARSYFDGGLSIVLLLVKAGLAELPSEARRLISQLAVFMNDRQVEDPTLVVKAPSPLDGSGIRLRAGNQVRRIVVD